MLHAEVAILNAALLFSLHYFIDFWSAKLFGHFIGFMGTELLGYFKDSVVLYIS